MAEKTTKAGPESKTIGLLAQFDDPDSLMAACTNARESGYKKMDAYTPFPVHGLDEALGVKRTWLPWIVLTVAFGALGAGIFLQFYTNGGSATLGTDDSPVFPGYRFMISGKPYWSLPANIPVIFEIIVLSSAFATFFGMWIMNRLPRLANPLHRISRFKRVTNDRFFLMVEDGDEFFDRGETESQMREWGAVAVEEVNQDLTDHGLPKSVKLAGLLVAMMLLIPPVMIFKAMGETSRSPRLHFNPDMDWQHKFKTQTVGPNMGNEIRPDYLFGNARAMQAEIKGTIPWGELNEDTEFYRGIQAGGDPVTISTTGRAVRTSLQEEGEAEEGEAEGAEASQAQEPAGETKEDGHTEQEGENADAGNAEPDAQAGDAPAVAEPNWVTAFPESLTISEEMVKRGQARFNIYCTPCHGYSGNGDGLVNMRALALAATGKAAWTAAKSLHDPTVKTQPVGRIFDTISNGRGTMGPYRSQIPVADRWAIVAYVKALQETGIEPPESTTAEVNPELKTEDESLQASR